MKIAMFPIQSSSIESIGHEMSKSRLHLKFKNGTYYSYANVDKDTFEDYLMDNEPGKRIRHEIIMKKSQHPFKIENHENYES